MSMVARTEPRPAEDDITDTDDGDTRISAGAFWPDIVLRELRLAVRLPGRVTTSRLLHTATGAVAHVTRELEAWQQEQQAAGHQTLADVPAPVINGESVNLWHWRNAVYTATRALILERYRDADTTDKGDRRADALDIQTSDLWRDVSWAISDILCRPRIFAESAFFRARERVAISRFTPAFGFRCIASRSSFSDKAMLSASVRPRRAKAHALHNLARTSSGMSWSVTISRRVSSGSIKADKSASASVPACVSTGLQISSVSTVAAVRPKLSGIMRL